MSLDSIPTLPRSQNVSGDDLLPIIDMSDRRSPKAVTLAGAVAAGVDNAAVNAAIAEDPESTFTALMGDGAVPPVNATAVIYESSALSYDGEPVTFSADLFYVGHVDGKPRYEGADNNSISWSIAESAWVLLNDLTGATWTNEADTLRPPESGWEPQGLADGELGVITAEAIEGYLGSMKVDSDYLYVVASVTDGVPVWKKIALTAL